MVKAGLAPLGKDYINKLQEGFDNRWIDIYENEGKEVGHIHGEPTDTSLCSFKLSGNIRSCIYFGT